MRDHARIGPTFWTRGSGKRLRGDSMAQAVASYICTCPSADMLGLFHVPIVLIAHDLGHSVEDVRRALAKIQAAGFAFYDEDHDLVFIPNAAKHQVGESLKANDNRVGSVRRALRAFGDHPFVSRFLELYGEAFCLAPKPLRSPSEAPPKPLYVSSESPSEGAPSDLICSDLICSDLSQTQSVVRGVSAPTESGPHVVLHTAPAEPGAPKNAAALILAYEGAIPSLVPGVRVAVADARAKQALWKAVAVHAYKSTGERVEPYREVEWLEHELAAFVEHVRAQKRIPSQTAFWNYEPPAFLRFLNQTPVVGEGPDPDFAPERPSGTRKASEPVAASQAFMVPKVSRVEGVGQSAPESNVARAIGIGEVDQ